MGMWGGYLTGHRARRQDDLRESQFGLQERKFTEDKRQSGLAGRRSDREYELRKGQMEEQSRRADVKMGLDKRASARAEAEAQRTADADRQRQMSARYGNAYQAALMGDEDEAVRVWNLNQDPMKHITGLTVDEQGNMMLDRRGTTAKIPYDQIRRYIPRDPTEGVGRTGGLGARMGSDDKNWMATKAFKDAQTMYEFPRDPSDKTATKLAPGFKTAFTTGIKATGSTAETAAALGLRMRLPPAIKDEVARLDEAMGALKPSTKVGRVRRAEEDAKNGLTWQTLNAQKQALLDQAVQQDPVVQAANQELTQQFSAFDTNQDQQIDELDADYQRAQRIVDLIAQNPEAKARIMQQYGGTVVAQAEALVQAVKQREKLTAQRRVGLGR